MIDTLPSRYVHEYIIDLPIPAPDVNSPFERDVYRSAAFVVVISGSGAHDLGFNPIRQSVGDNKIQFAKINKHKSGSKAGHRYFIVGFTTREGILETLKDKLDTSKFLIREYEPNRPPKGKGKGKSNHGNRNWKNPPGQGSQDPKN